MTIGNDLWIAAYFNFAVRFDEKTDEPIEWTRDPAKPKKLIEALFTVPLLRDHLQVGRVGNNKFKPITAKTAPLLFKKGDDVLLEAQDVADDDRIQLSVHMYGGVDVRVVVRPEKVPAVHATLLDDLILVAQRAAKALRGTAGLISAVIYPDDRGGFWDPDPEGPWLPTRASSRTSRKAPSASRRAAPRPRRR